MPFDPTSISGCVGWYAADQIAQGDGTAVASWPDGSASGFNATQSTPGNQPTLQLAGLNGHPTVDFTGAGGGQWLVLGGAPTVGSVFFFLDYANATFAGFEGPLGNVGFGGSFVGLEGVGSGTTGLATSMASSTISINGVAGTDFSPLPTAKCVSVIGTPAATGAAPQIGWDNSGQAKWLGHISEIILYDRALNATEQGQVESYLIAKYAAGSAATMGPLDGRILWGGYPLLRGIGGGVTVVALYGAGTEARLSFAGTELEMQAAAQGSAATWTLSVDGGAATDVTVPVQGGTAWQTLASGLADTTHTVVLKAPGSSGQSAGLDQTTAFRANGSAPAFSDYAAMSGTAYLLDGTNAAGIVPDTGIALAAGFQSYPHDSYFAWDLSSVRFRARCAALWLWAYDQAEHWGLSVDGADQAPYVGMTGATGDWNWFQIAVGLDDTAYHDYTLRRVWENAGIPAGSPHVYQLLGQSATGGNIDLAHPPAIPTPSFAGFGDSVTEAVQTTPADGRIGYVYLLGTDLTRDPVNRGINGTTLHDYTSQGGQPWNVTTSSGEARAAADIGGISPVPAVCVEIYGVNDLIGNTAVGGSLILSQAGMQTACQNMYSAILTAHPDIRILAVGILPIAGSTFQTVRAQFNAAKQAAVAATQAAFPSSSIAYLDPDGWIDPGSGTYPTGGSADTVDGLHPNVSGHQKIATQLLLVLYALTGVGGGVGGAAGTLSLSYPLAATGGGVGGGLAALGLSYPLAGVGGGVGGMAGTLTIPLDGGYTFVASVTMPEAAGSPLPVVSWAPPQQVWWALAGVLASGETVQAVAVTVLAYDPASPDDTTDVTGTILADTPAAGTGSRAGQVGIRIAAGVPVVGQEYRFECSAVTSDGTNPAGWFRVRCVL